VAGASAVALTATLFGLGGGGGALADAGPCGTATTAAPATFDHVVLLIFENKNQDQILSGTAAPYLKSLSQQCGRGTDMNTPDPLTSLGNYIALTSGYYGHPKYITANRGPATWPQDSVSIFEQVGGKWREFAENAPTNCYTGSQAYDFTVNHTPAPYYTRIKSECQTKDVPMGATPDLSAAFTLLSPNKSHIMHEDDAPGKTTQAQRIKAGDDWAAGYLPKVFASPEYQSGRTVVIITWDEATSRRNDVPFIVASPYTPVGYVTNVHMTHYSTLKGMEQMLGLPLLGHAGDAGVPSIRDYYGLS
jgi:phosphatidylinositol-3-phosphatase